MCNTTVTSVLQPCHDSEKQAVQCAHPPESPTLFCFQPQHAATGAQQHKHTVLYVVEVGCSGPQVHYNPHSLNNTIGQPTVPQLAAPAMQPDPGARICVHATCAPVDREGWHAVRHCTAKQAACSGCSWRLHHKQFKKKHTGVEAMGLALGGRRPAGGQSGLHTAWPPLMPRAWPSAPTKPDTNTSR